MVYLDNSATSWPKPNRVYRAVYEFMKKSAANPGRGGHKMAVEASEVVYYCRELMCSMFNASNPSNVVFTKNTTEALNMAIKGVIKKGDHIIATSMEHNSVLRVLYKLASEGFITYDIVYADNKGYVKCNDIEAKIKPNTRLVVVNHISNVCGSIQPIYEIGALCKRHKLYFLVDGAQSGGIVPIDMYKNNISLLALAGHKGLMGPMGTGALIVADGIGLNTIFEGGTGSYSKELLQPLEMPDRLEAGTLNAPGICGLLEGLKYITVVGINNIYEHELALTRLFLKGLNDIKNIKVYGPTANDLRCGVVSLNIEGKDCVETAEILSNRYNIAVRAGYHCAYTAHETIGSSDTGTIRFSFGPFNTAEDVKKSLFALKNMSL